MARLKSDLFGSIELATDARGRAVVIRNVREARWWVRPLAHALARREARALQRLVGLRGVPRYLGFRSGRLERDWLPGAPMQQARPSHPHYFREAARLLRRLHARGVVHNDLAKEPNWLVTPEGDPALVDFQLAHVSRRRRGRLARALAYDDIRHLLKHKRSYLPSQLTARERLILAMPSLPARLWMRAGKPCYVFVTRRLFGWSDREGAGDRDFRSPR